MPKHKFQVSIDQWSEIHEFPDCWPLHRLRELIVLLEYEDPLSDEDLPEVVLMLLEDLGPRRAAEMVLEAEFGRSMSAGVRQNIAGDLQDDAPWSQHSVVAQQAGIFDAVVLLHRAMPRFFGPPEAVCFQLNVTTVVPEAQAGLTENVNAGLIVRLLAQGMDPEATLNRLYEDELNGDWFPAAKDILWRITQLDTGHYSIISSFQWMASLEHQNSWLATAAFDRAPGLEETS